MRVSVSVVTYNNEEHIGNLLDSIRQYVELEDYQVFIIDNGSHDQTLDIIRKNGDIVTLIENGSNVGFGAGHNKVLSMIESKYHVIINPDIILKTDTIGEMAAYLDNNPDIALISPQILYPEGGVQVLPKRDPKPIYVLARRSNIGMLAKYKEQYEMKEAGTDSAYDIEFASGCFMFTRTEVLKKVGGFDDRFFLYLEDADLSRRIRQHGRIQYNPAFVVYHHWQQAGAKKLKFLLIHIASMFKYLKKWKSK